MKKVIGIIPARYDSSRFPGKPLIKIKNKTMIEWTYRSVRLSSLDDIYVATDNAYIYDEVTNFGGKAIYTSKDHETGTDRIIEAFKKVSKRDNIDIIVNIQGDEPCIEKELIEGVVSLKKRHNKFSLTTAAVLMKKKDVDNLNRVKVIFDKNYKALYFSRLPIPYNSDKYYKHVGIYAYDKDFLMDYNSLKSSWEKFEQLEQLRVLQNGYDIGIFVSENDSFSVDVPDDVSIAELEISKRFKI